MEHWSLTTLWEKLVKIGAKVVRHGRYVTFQLAELAVPSGLFAEILRGTRASPCADRWMRLALTAKRVRIGGRRSQGLLEP
jgi:hypothetical protein